MLNPPRNMLDEIPGDLPEEIFQTLMEADNMRIERIISHGHASPPGFWFDQPQAEWVLLVRGAAELTLGEKPLKLLPGDYVEIPPHVKHRVEWTTPDEPTIWLAVHFDAAS